MSLTPIYDELRELRITENAGGTTGGKRRNSRRLAATQTTNGSVGQLTGRRGLGGRHRRPSD